jgi:hypothetical protein
MNKRQMIISLAGVLLLFAIATGFGYVCQTFLGSPWNYIAAILGGLTIGAVGVKQIVKIANS